MVIALIGSRTRTFSPLFRKFLYSTNGKGEKEINDFVSLWKTFEETLSLIHQDNAVLKDLEKQLSAAEQGIELQ